VNDPFVEAIGELQQAIEIVGETWKTVSEFDGPALHNKLNLAALANQCMCANGPASHFGSEIPRRRH
jgi:hypothetical protein